MLVTGVNFSNNSHIQKEKTSTARTSFRPSYDTVNFGSSQSLNFNLTKILSAMQENISDFFKESQKGKYVREITNQKGKVIGQRYKKKDESGRLVFTTYDLENRITETSVNENGKIIKETFYPNGKLKKSSVQSPNGEIKITKFDSNGRRNRELLKANFSLYLDIIDPYSQTVIERITRAQLGKIDGKTFNDTSKEKYLLGSNKVIEASASSIKHGKSKWIVNPETGDSEFFVRYPDKKIMKFKFVTVNGKSKKIQWISKEPNGDFDKKKYHPEKEGEVTIEHAYKQGKIFTWKKHDYENPEKVVATIEVTASPKLTKAGKPGYRWVKKEVNPKNPDQMIVTIKEPGEPKTSRKDNLYIG